MNATTETKPANNRELVLTRILDATPAQLFKAWTTADLIKQWWAPKPYQTPEVELDARPGGMMKTLMLAPDGTEHPHSGVFLELEQDRRIVFTDAFGKDWLPSQKPFMVAEVILEDLGGGKTRYTAYARHWTVEDCKAHEKMGFHEGWGQVAGQLEAVASKL
ncbi:SRPBCC family protein [Sinorhizobium sp. BG8]|uniref:SRPBCC family protein n=1 Tax=Sinorhizobium sp. BG8 TaxID=2613773 RepID=UPI00193DC2BB|nr:SRPBCC family protein [Sinorhizobium sp. BG8]QRM56358.1 SRPBCC family protein [Sinorhizobium sp. BG8]